MNERRYRIPARDAAGRARDLTLHLDTDGISVGTPPPGSAVVALHHVPALMRALHDLHRRGRQATTPEA